MKWMCSINCKARHEVNLSLFKVSLDTLQQEESQRENAALLWIIPLSLGHSQSLCKDSDRKLIAPVLSGDFYFFSGFYWSALS